jgi:hypothetical protein
MVSIEPVLLMPFLTLEIIHSPDYELSSLSPIYSR